LRYYVEGILAVFYGRRVLLFFKDNGLAVIMIAGAAIVVGVVIYLLINWRRNIGQPAHSDGGEAGVEDSPGSRVDHERTTD